MAQQKITLQTPALQHNRQSQVGLSELFILFSNNLMIYVSSIDTPLRVRIKVSLFALWLLYDRDVILVV